MCIWRVGGGAGSALAQGNLTPSITQPTCQALGWVTPERDASDPVSTLQEPGVTDALLALGLAVYMH